MEQYFEYRLATSLEEVGELIRKSERKCERVCESESESESERERGCKDERGCERGYGRGRGRGRECERGCEDENGRGCESEGRRPRVVNCLNPHSFWMAKEDEQFHRALINSDVLLPDGEGICLTLKRYGGGRRVEKIAGADVHRYLLDRLSRGEFGSKRVYYVGSTELCLKRIEERLGREYPEIEMRGVSPSYSEEMSEEESRLIIREIVRYGASAVFVGLGAPKQEKLVLRWIEEGGVMGSVRVVACIGAVFDFYSGQTKRAPRWAIKMKIEWLVRLMQNPRKMWRRTLVSAPRFGWWVSQHRKEM